MFGLYIFVTDIKKLGLLVSLNKRVYASFSMGFLYHVQVLYLFMYLFCFLIQLRAAANAVGEVNLESKFSAASDSLRRGIMFANSLYLQIVLCFGCIFRGSRSSEIVVFTNHFSQRYFLSFPCLRCTGIQIFGYFSINQKEQISQSERLTINH